MIKSIALNKLAASPRNVRRTADDQADQQLKADIEARGLLQNLVVTSLAKPRGCFAVEAGGRRLRALHALVEEGKLSKTHEVCCLVIEGGQAEVHEAGLAENFQRLSMNPADECLAFKQLIAQGADVEGIARRFGLTQRFVEGRLRLATLAPALFEALGAGEISLDVAKAYAATPDQERQAYVFEQMGRGYGATHPDSIRRMMTQATASGTDRRARLVGEDAYLAAGGRIEQDLFSDDDGARWLDIALLDRLAGEKMHALAAEAAKQSGLGWVRPTLERWISHADTESLRHVETEKPPLSAEESALADSLEEQVGQLILLVENEGTSDEVRANAEARISELDAEIDAIVNKPPLIDEKLKARAGAFLMLDDTGRPKLDHGRFVEISENASSESGPGARGDSAGISAGGTAIGAAKSSGLSQRLVDELAIQRRDILGVHVACDTGLALDLAIFLMIDGRSGYSYERSGSSLSAVAPLDPVVGFKTPEAAAIITSGQARDALDRSWASADRRAERFEAFRALCDDGRAAWLGHAVARTLEASLNLPGARSCAFHDHLGQLHGIEVARWWRPTGANYFDRVPKSVALAALEEVGGPALASVHAGSKKAELAQSCERIFAGDFIAEAQVKERALAWVPEVMRFAQAPDTAAHDKEKVAGTDPDGEQESVAEPGSLEPAADELQAA